MYWEERSIVPSHDKGADLKHKKSNSYYIHEHRKTSQQGDVKKFLYT